MVERHRTVLILLAVLLVASVGPVSAQNGACPPNSWELATPGGTSPDNTKVCAYNPYITSVTTTDNYPCGQQVTSLNISTVAADFWDQASMSFVPPVNTYLSQIARVKFYIYPFQNLPLSDLIPPGLDIAEATVRVEYYTSTGTLYSYTNKPMTDFRKVSTYYDGVGSVRHYYNVYLVDVALATDNGYGGFFVVKVNVANVNAFSKSVSISSFRAGAYSDAMAEMCPIPNASSPQSTPTPPATPTALPTWTPDPGNPTPTPITIILPTAPPNLDTPQPTPTTGQLIFPTIQAEATPTPWPPYSIPPIVWPTAGPTVLAGAVPTLDTTGLDLSGLADDIQDEWGGALAASQSGLDGSITSTTGIASPDSIALEITEGIGKPISYVKTVEVYAPNLAGYIRRFLYLAVWVVFSRNARFFLSIAVKLFELIRRIWEMIPFVG
jgi:hypothetical protein